MPPKVLILFDTHVVSGPAKGMFEFLRNSEKSRFEFAVATFDYQNPKSRDFIEAVQREGLPLRLLKQRFALDPAPILEVLRLTRAEGFTLLESHGYKTHILAAMVKFFAGVKWLAFSHGWTAENFKVRIYHFLDSIFLRFADFSVAMSPPMQDTLRKWIKDPAKIMVISNAVERPAVLPDGTRELIRNELNIAADVVLLGCFGRLSAEKGQSFLLKALARLPRNTKVQLVMVGDGVDRAALEAEATALGLSDQVHFVGFKRNVRPYYAAIDLLVLPSLSEGMPNVVLEALSYGVPVVTTDVGAVREAVTEKETGWVVPPGNVEALAHALTAAIEDPTLRQKIGAAGLKALYPKFDPRFRAEKIVALYERFGSTNVS